MKECELRRFNVLLLFISHLTYLNSRSLTKKITISLRILEVVEVVMDFVVVLVEVIKSIDTIIEMIIEVDTMTEEDQVQVTILTEVLEVLEVETMAEVTVVAVAMS